MVHTIIHKKDIHLWQPQVMEEGQDQRRSAGIAQDGDSHPQHLRQHLNTGGVPPGSRLQDVPAVIQVGERTWLASHPIVCGHDHTGSHGEYIFCMLDQTPHTQPPELLSLVDIPLLIEAKVLCKALEKAVTISSNLK